MTSIWKRINSMRSRRSFKSSSWSSSDADSSAGELFVNNSLIKPKKSRSRIEKSDLKIEAPPWFRVDMTRESSAAFLSGRRIGSFVVRGSSSQPGCFALSVRVPTFNNRSGISHYLISRTSQGTFKIKGLDKEWSRLDSLIIHHTVMKEMLPCTLRLTPTATAENDAENEGEEEEEDEEEEEEGREREQEDTWNEDSDRRAFAESANIATTAWQRF